MKSPRVAPAEATRPPGGSDASSAAAGDTSRHEALDDASPVPSARVQASPEASGDPSPITGGHVAPAEATRARSAGDGCRWCGAPIPNGARRDAVFCSKVHRQAAYRCRRRAVSPVSAGSCGRFAFADPPYVGLARRYYGREESYAGEVDHVELLKSLERGGYLGWALACSSSSLVWLLRHCPADVRVFPWVKPMPPDPRAAGPTTRTEFVIVRGGRALEGVGVRDYLYAAPARQSGEPRLMGRKPLAYCAWLFGILGMQPGDTLDDRFPGTGIVSRAWAEISRSSTGDASALQ